jgi:2,3-bisphosphoglycerate-dependent phosphoglycerate mutase
VVCFVELISNYYDTSTCKSNLVKFSCYLFFRCDVSLTQTGKNEARIAGRLLYENGIEIDQAFTSVLKRASSSCNMALAASLQHWVPVTKTWRLNERHYGALQGYNKDTAWKELSIDQEVVMQMRRAYDVRPPRMEDDHPYWHGNDRR